MIPKLKQQGYLLQIDAPQRSDTIRQSVALKSYFTEPVSLPDVKPMDLGLYLVGMGRRKVSMLALGVPTGTPATSSSRIKIKRIIEFDELSIRSLISRNELSETIYKRLVDENHVNVAEPVFNEMLQRIAKRNPTLAKPITKLIEIANGIDFNRAPVKAALFAMQQDALSAVLKSSRIRLPAVEDRWDPDEFDDSLTYLDGFLNATDGEKALEDEIITHDTLYFKGLKSKKTHWISTRIFRDDRSRLFVTMANRKTLEDVLGVDLIYFNETHGSFTLVQYKKMEKKGSTFVYYPSSDGNYNKDVALMKLHTKNIKLIEQKHIGNPLDKFYENYRVFKSPFFFKFVNSVVFTPFRNTVIHGHYVSFDLWTALAAERNRDNKTLRASSADLEKHLSANEFCALLSRGMLGSRSASATEIARIIADCIKGDRSVVLARRQNLVPADEDESAVFTLDEE